MGGPTAVSRVEAELWREANADSGGAGFLGTRITTDDGEVVYADRMKLMAWCAPRPPKQLWVYKAWSAPSSLPAQCAHVKLLRTLPQKANQARWFADSDDESQPYSRTLPILCPKHPLQQCRSAYFKTRFRSEVGQSEDSAAIDVSGVAGSLLRTLVEAMYSHEVC